jgi:hypothetical protein
VGRYVLLVGQQLLEENALHFGQSLLAGILVANAVSFTRKLLGSFVLSNQTIRVSKYSGRDFQTRPVRRKHSGAPNFTERGAVEGVQVDGGVAFVVREDELPLDLHADEPEVHS